MKKISIILIDCSYRERFHTPVYLNRQNYNRNDYEIIWAELYGDVNETIRKYKEDGIIDKLIIMDQPKKKFYELPKLWNEAVLQSEGEYVCIMDGDAICSNDFIINLITPFSQNKKMFVLCDEVRHEQYNTLLRKDGLFKNWNEVVRKKQNEPRHYNVEWNYMRTKHIHSLCKHIKGMPLLSRDDVNYGMFDRNYGACFCIKRDAVIEAGGFDEHGLFDGLLGGPYELGWRLFNRGYKEYWVINDFLVHIFHEGTDGKDEEQMQERGYMNKHCLKRLESNSYLPFVENQTIQKMRFELERRVVT